MCHVDKEDLKKTYEDNEDIFLSIVSEIKKDGFMIFDGRPCKILYNIKYGYGKHGRKSIIHWVDIFTGEKYLEHFPISHKVFVPVVVYKEWQVMCIEDAFLILFDPDTGNIRSDLSLPNQTEDDKRNAFIIQESCDKGENIYVTVLSAMGEEKVVDLRQEYN
jgi:translation elongation factor IF5A